jgi:hypothetical protein
MPLKTITMKYTLLFIFPMMLLCAVRSFAQRITFDSLVANSASNKSLVFTPSVYQNGYGHRIYGIDGGGKTDLRFASRHNTAAWTDIMAITSNGNVGIGTNQPGDRLEIAGSLGSMKFSNSGVRMMFTRPNANYIEATSAGGFFIFSTGGAQERMRIDSAGRIGIGTNNPAAPLNVQGGTYTNELSQFAANSTLRVDVANPAISIGIGYSSTDNPTLQAFNNISNVANNLLLNPCGGSVVIGSADPKGYKFAVAGSMIAERVVVKLKSNWPDYVFSKDYHLPSLQETEHYINVHQHLPGMPAAAEVEQQGQDIGEINRVLTQKVEELTLYLIEQQKQIAAFREEIKQLKELVKDKP